MNRLIEKTVRRELVIACRLAGSPTKRSPLSVKATTLGVSRFPSWFGMTLTSPPSMTATTELVVPRSMPMIFSPCATVWLLSSFGWTCFKITLFASAMPLIRLVLALSHNYLDALALEHDSVSENNLPPLAGPLTVPKRQVRCCADKDRFYHRRHQKRNKNDSHPRFIGPI